VSGAELYRQTDRQRVDMECTCGTHGNEGDGVVLDGSSLVGVSDDV